MLGLLWHGWSWYESRAQGSLSRGEKNTWTLPLPALPRWNGTVRNDMCQFLQPQKEFLQFLAHLVDALGLINGFPSLTKLPFKPLLFCCALGWVSLSTGPLVISFPPVGPCIGGGIYVIIVSSPLLPFSMSSLSHLLCRSCSICSQFFTKIVLYVGVDLVCPQEEAGSVVSYATILDYPPLYHIF